MSGGSTDGGGRIQDMGGGGPGPGEQEEKVDGDPEASKLSDGLGHVSVEGKWLQYTIYQCPSFHSLAG